MYHEAAALARELDPRWNYRSAELMTLYAKAKAHEAGEKVEFGGKQLSPLYTPKNDTLSACSTSPTTSSASCARSSAGTWPQSATASARGPQACRWGCRSCDL
jgi:hypothetical protein